MIVNSKIKHKSKAVLGVIRNLVLNIIIYFVTAYMRNYPIHVTSAQGTIQNALLITRGSKYRIFHNKQFTTITAHKNFQNYYSEKCIYNVNAHCSLLYALKVWNYLNFIQKRRFNFFCLMKLLFIKVRCLILNVNKICSLLRNEWRTAKWVVNGRLSLNVSFIFL